MTKSLDIEVKSERESRDLCPVVCAQAIKSGDMKFEGKRETFTEFIGLLDEFPFWFNIVTP